MTNFSPQPNIGGLGLGGGLGANGGGSTGYYGNGNSHGSNLQNAVSLSLESLPKLKGDY